MIIGSFWISLFLHLLLDDVAALWPWYVLHSKLCDSIYKRVLFFCASLDFCIREHIPESNRPQIKMLKTPSDLSIAHVFSKLFNYPDVMFP